MENAMQSFGSIGFFDATAQVGSHILDVLAGKRASIDIQRYLDNVAKIYKLLVSIHDELAEVAIKISLATSMDEARESLKRIEQNSLTDTFRVRQWCDELQRLGHALGPLHQDTGLSNEDQEIWYEFCIALQNREGGVAMLYDRNLYDFRMLAYSEPSLESLKKKVIDISEQLVIQKAEFDLLAKKAEAMRARLI